MALPGSIPPDSPSVLAAAWQLQHSGNFVAAFDLAQEGLQQWPDSQPLQHLSILALASCGSTQAALAALRASTLAETDNEDFLALEARLLKDLAFKSPSPEAQQQLAAAAEAYERTAQRTGGNYTRQNAALLWMLAGDDARAVGLASSVTANVGGLAVPADAQAAYFHWATLAEAALVLGDRALLAEAVSRANPLCRGNLWARARTFAQMRRLLEVREDCAELVEQWYRPAVGLVLMRGQEVATGPCVEAGESPALAYAVGAELNSDWQRLRADGIALHVILARSANRQSSGHGDGYTWSSLLLDEGDDVERECAETALGLSLGHADAMQAPWVVLDPRSGRWVRCQDFDRGALGVTQDSERGALGAAQRFERGGLGAAQDRKRYGILFADAVGYSNLSVGDTRRYWTKLLPEATAAVLQRHSEQILFRKTWGDAIHVVFRTASAAARAALEMNAATARLAEELEFGRRLEFRTAVHFGTADFGMDSIEEAPTFYGPQLSLAARIVPVAPPGGVFVTEPCAAQLSLDGNTNIECTYVGTTSLAKGYGRVRLLNLASR